MASTEKTDATFDRFIDYAKDASNWAGNPLVGGNVGCDSSDKGYLVNMKKRGWITTFVDDQDNTVWISFTPKGEELALSNGIELDE